MSDFRSPVCSLPGVAARRPAAAWQRLELRFDDAVDKLREKPKPAPPQQ